MKRKILSFVLACQILGYTQIPVHAAEANVEGENIGYVYFHKVPYCASFARRIIQQSNVLGGYYHEKSYS